MLTTDHLIHAWDLARAMGADQRLDPEVVDFVYAYFEPQAERWRAAGALGLKIEVPAGSDRRTRLLALAGRRV